MTTVVANMSVSLDGFVAVPTADPQRTFHTDEASAADLRDLFAGVGALICLLRQPHRCPRSVGRSAGHRRGQLDPPALPRKAHHRVSCAPQTRLRPHDTDDGKESRVQIENKKAIGGRVAKISGHDPVAVIVRRVRP